jgi:hypothetical protein
MKGVIECRQGKKSYAFRYKGFFQYFVTLVKCSIKGYEHIINHKNL